MSYPIDSKCIYMYIANKELVILQSYKGIIMFDNHCL